MQHFANICRPLTALILLGACSSGHSTTSLGDIAQDSVDSATAGIEADVCDDAADPGLVDPTIPPDPVDSVEPPCDTAHSGADAGVPSGSDAGSVEPPAMDAGSVEVPEADAGAVTPESGCGNSMVEAGEQCDLGSANGGDDCAEDCTLPPPAPLPLGACLSCAQSTCPAQFANALGAESSPSNFEVVGELLACVIGADWQTGGGIPADSCFFADPTQPAGSMVPCYCGSTPTAQCLATGPVDSSEACGRQIELASGCATASASCVTVSGSSPAVALGDVLQLFNCERVACTVECGFPAPIEE